MGLFDFLSSAGGGALGGGIIGGVASAFGQNSANSAARNERRQSQAYNTQMSNTAYQRGVQDLEKAGLNRVLAAGGSAASAPTSSAAPQGNVMEGANQAFSATAQAIMAKEKLGSEISLTKAQAKAAKATAKGIKADNEKKEVMGDIWNTLGQMSSSARNFKKNQTKRFNDYYNKPTELDKKMQRLGKPDVKKTIQKKKGNKFRTVKYSAQGYKK